MLLYTGQRAGDVVKMRRSDLPDGLIPVIQEKTGVELSILLRPALMAAIKAAPAKCLILIGDANGRPIRRAKLNCLPMPAKGLPSSQEAELSRLGFIDVNRSLGLTIYC